MRVAGLFAGIKGLEVGLGRAGHDTVLVSEILPEAQAVLKARFPDVDLCGDVRALRSLPSVDLIAAGFPCQDLSQAGLGKGLAGARSSLVSEVFRLAAALRPRWMQIPTQSGR